MEHEIEQLRLEITAYEDELGKLQNELSELSKHKAQAQQTVEQRPVIQGLQNAIAELDSRLKSKQRQLSELERQREVRLRRQRLEEGRAAVRAKIADIQKRCGQLKSEYLELKQLELRFGSDFRLELNRSYGGLNEIDALVMFRGLTLPELKEVKQTGNFALTCSFFDPWAEERLQERAAQTARLSQIQAQTKAQVAADQQQRAAQKQRQEQERLENLLKIKQSELKEALSTQAEWKSQAKRGVALDFSRINGYIAGLEAEIEKVHAQLHQVA